MPRMVSSCAMKILLAIVLLFTTLQALAGAAARARIGMTATDDRVTDHTFTDA